MKFIKRVIKPLSKEDARAVIWEMILKQRMIERGSFDELNNELFN